LDTKTFSSTAFPVFRGQTINFTVGFGQNASYASDSTGFDARITLVRSNCHKGGRSSARPR
jgi:hypothetical protein